VHAERTGLRFLCAAAGFEVECVDIARIDGGPGCR
jgi:hypothetical protein